jgi:hypothetical protein
MNLFENKPFEKVSKLEPNNKGSQKQNMQNMNKRGSHVGIIASFSIFVLFLVGIYFVLDPMLRLERDKQLALEYLEAELLTKFSSNLTKAIINKSGVTSLCCYDTDVGVESNLYSIAKKEDGTILRSSYKASDGLLSINSDGEEFVWVYYSPVEFYNEDYGSFSCWNTDVASVRTSKEIFEKKIIDDGINDFDNLVTAMNLPNTEFSFSFEMENGTILSAGEKNTSVNIYAREIPIQYIDFNATNLAGKLTIRVWG